MQETLNEILSETRKIKEIEKEVKKISEIEKEVKKISEIEKEVKKISEIEKETKKISEIIEMRLDQYNSDVAEEIHAVVEIIEMKFVRNSTNEEIIKKIKELEQKLERKTKEDKESFKANTARLNKIELTQEYFESKIDDMKNTKKAEKVAI